MALMHAIWTNTASVTTLLKWRTVCVVGIRLVHSLLFAQGSMPLFNMEPLHEGRRSFWAKCVMDIGVLEMAWLGLGFPLLFRHHVVLHTGITLFEMTVMPKRFCAHVVWSDGVLQEHLRQSGGQLSGAGMNMTRCAQALPVLGSEEMSGMYNLLTESTRIIFSAMHIHLPCLVSSASACIGVVLFLQLMVSWWVPTTILYYMERKSRAVFLDSMAQEGHETVLAAFRAEQERERSLRQEHGQYRIIWRLVAGWQVLGSLMAVWQILTLWAS